MKNVRERWNSYESLKGCSILKGYDMSISSTTLSGRSGEIALQLIQSITSKNNNSDKPNPSDVKNNIQELVKQAGEIRDKSQAEFRSKLIENALKANNAQSQDKVKDDNKVKVDVSLENQASVDKIQKIIGDAIDITQVKDGSSSRSLSSVIYQNLYDYLEDNPYALSQDQMKEIVVEYYKIGVREGRIEDRHGLMDKLVSGDYQIYMGDELNDPMFDQVNYAFKRKEGGGEVSELEVDKSQLAPGTNERARKLWESGKTIASGDLFLSGKNAHRWRYNIVF